ncbi:sulfate permease 2 [Cordyceps militaris]|uniref:Sulfate permease 2 n=1 Tax=Cordyceps militaris TaxID=73501 RepID=A0A2H4SGI7_CORMI|nr:sulfate permease 2 [Cordyceps militaris]
MSENAGSRLAKSLLGVDTNARYAHQPQHLEERARAVLGSVYLYAEEEPTVSEWLKEQLPTKAGAVHYIWSLFPSVFWIRRYNPRWLLGDVVAGITIGLVVVPQAMAYAVLAGLTPAYGLYTSFTGAVLYWLFGTSKDIVIGTTAVGSLLVGQVVDRVVSKDNMLTYSNEDIARTLTLLCGIVLLFFGLLRLGWVIEFIPYIPISAFVTAASITIMATQLPTTLGISGIKNQAPPYRVIIDTLESLHKTKIDAAIGLSSIALLFGIRGFCSHMESRYPAHKRAWSFVSSLRLTFTMVLFTLISFLVNRGHADSPKFRIVGHIERGFQRIGVPRVDMPLFQAVLPELPAVAIILIIEHIAIAKAMGRLYNYNIRPSQEIVALGAANLLSPFVGGYVCTGSFGASAVLSKAGVRTPLAGLFSALMLVLALYALTGVFYYIPKAALSGLIIHAVCSLIAPPKNLYRYWQLSPFELIIWVACVFMAIFQSLDHSIYLGVGLSLALLLIRVARANGGFVGIARSQRVPVDGEDTASKFTRDVTTTKDVFLPLNRQDSSNPAILLDTPYPGVFVYRLHDSYNYMNQALHVDILQSHLMENTRRTSDEHYEHESDRLWNDAGPRDKLLSQHLPCLRALILDFSAVNNIDITSIQGLVDLRNVLDQSANGYVHGRAPMEKRRRSSSDAPILLDTLNDDEDAAAEVSKAGSTQPASPFAIFAIFTGLALMIICIALDRSIVATAVPQITSEFRSLSDAGWYGSAYLMSTCCLQLFFGKLYAEFRVKWVFLSALVLFEAGSVVCAAAPSSLVLIVGRAVAGAGCAGLMSGAFILIRFFIPVDELPKYTGALGGMSGIAQIIAPTLGGVLTDKASWRWCFWINLPIGGVTFLVILFLVQIPAESTTTTTRSLGGFLSRFDLVGTLIFIPTILCLLLALQWGGVEYAWDDWRLVVLLSFFSSLLVLWVVSQYLQGATATVPLAMIRQRSLAGGVLFVFCYFAAFFIITYYVPIWFQAVRGASAYASGINMLAASAAMSVAVIGSGFMVSKVGYYVPNMIASVIVASVGCGLVYTFDRETSTATWAAALVLTGLGIGLGIQQPIIAAQTTFTGSDLAIATSVLIFLQSLSGTVFLSVAQNVFQGTLLRVIQQTLPDVDPAEVLGVGASELGAAMQIKYPDRVGAILDAYNEGLRSVFLVSVVFACVGSLAVPLMEWRCVKKKA